MKEKKIHVCHLVYSFDVGGLEQIIVNSINSLDSNRYQHTIVALTEVSDFVSKIKRNVDYYSLNKGKGNDFSIYLRLYRIFRKYKFDVLHTYNLATIEYHWIAAIAGVPKRVHAEHGWDSYDPKGKNKKYRFIRKVTSSVIHHIVAVSQDLKDWLRRDVGIAESKLLVILNGVDTTFFSPSNNANRANNRFVFGHVARLHGIKNQNMLLDSFELACESNKSFRDNCVLYIVGDGPCRNDLEFKAYESTYLKGRVHFFGNQLEVIDYYRQFDVFTMSSIAEGIPMTLLESMAVGLPHVLTAVGGIKEVAIDKETGYLLDPSDVSGFANALVHMHNSLESRSCMSVRCRERIINGYSQEILTKKYSDIYESIKRE